MATIEDFQKLDIRVGKILEVEDFHEARKPVFKLTIDFGPEIGVKKSAAGVVHYGKEKLKTRLILGVVNLPPLHVGPFTSEVLTLGVSDREEKCILIQPDNEVEHGSKLY